MKRIPILAAKQIATDYGYDQVIVVARKVGTHPAPFGEHITTFGVDKIHCSVAARAGRALQRFMGWKGGRVDPVEPGEQLRIAEMLVVACSALRSYQHGNAAPDLAKSIADDAEDALIAAGFTPIGRR